MRELEFARARHSEHLEKRGSDRYSLSSSRIPWKQAGPATSFPLRPLKMVVHPESSAERSRRPERGDQAGSPCHLFHDCRRRRHSQHALRLLHAAPRRTLPFECSRLRGFTAKARRFVALGLRCFGRALQPDFPGPSRRERSLDRPQRRLLGLPLARRFSFPGGDACDISGA